MKKLVCITSIALWMTMGCTPDNVYDDYPKSDNTIASPSKQQRPLQPMAHENDSVIEDEDWDLSIPNAVGNPQDIIRQRADLDFDSIVPVPGTEPFSLEN